jgi:hypothetical protein
VLSVTVAVTVSVPLRLPAVYNVPACPVELVFALVALKLAPEMLDEKLNVTAWFATALPCASVTVADNTALCPLGKLVEAAFSVILSVLCGLADCTAIVTDAVAT